MAACAACRPPVAFVHHRVDHADSAGRKAVRDRFALPAAARARSHDRAAAAGRLDVAGAPAGARDIVTDSFDVFLESTDPLVPTNAVAALLMLAEGRYIMQLRDFKPHIF